MKPDSQVHRLEQHVYLPRVAEDRESAVHSGVSQTPTVFVNGERFDGQWNGHDFIEVLESHIKRHAG